MTETNLLPCKQCGEANQFTDARLYHEGTGVRGNVYVRKCDECDYAVVAIVNPWDENRTSLAEVWNHRSPAPSSVVAWLVRWDGPNKAGLYQQVARYTEGEAKALQYELLENGWLTVDVIPLLAAQEAK